MKIQSNEYLVLTTIGCFQQQLMDGKNSKCINHKRYQKKSIQYASIGKSKMQREAKVALKEGLTSVNYWLW
jgi:hypothetical protein